MYNYCNVPTCQCNVSIHVWTLIIGEVKCSHDGLRHFFGDLSFFG